MGGHAGAILAVVDQDDREHSADSAATIATCPGVRGELMNQLHQARAGPP